MITAAEPIQGSCGDFSIQGQRLTGPGGLPGVVWCRGGHRSTLVALRLAVRAVSLRASTDAPAPGRTIGPFVLRRGGSIDFLQQWRRLIREGPVEHWLDVN